MNTLIILSTILAVAFAKPGLFLSPQIATYSVPVLTKLVPGAPIGLDGRVVDTPEVAYAKAEHAAAHINERITLANEAVRSADHLIAYTSPVLATSNLENLSIAKIVPSAPIGPDGRVVDTPEVAYAKAEHAAAHINEKLGLSAEAGKPIGIPLLLSPYSAPVIHSLS
ncbi:PREDICTED: cuticle protein 18.7-like [Dufourea novaeangliae]|uniref:cuticle protein 18.7-like n=1 Tax=Dufourea novaeangliae TaxID=178035 RepID=UPI000766F9F5|nr:PREDICTED: cuticle protein 18.7-like [Dufourea novaeangliae]